MKIKKKKPSLYSDSESQAPSGGVASWAITDRAQFRHIAKAAKTEGNRAPEFWLIDGERKMIYFVDQDAVVSFRAYNLRRNGRTERYVAPAEGEPDLFASELNLRPVSYFVFRVIDIDGYKSKRGKNAGKHLKNIPRFYVVGPRMYEQIRLQVVETTGMKLNSGPVLACRSGEGAQSVYTFMPRPGRIDEKVKKAILNFPKWQDYYKPLSLKAQRALVSSLGNNPADED